MQKTLKKWIKKELSEDGFAISGTIAAIGAMLLLLPIFYQLISFGIEKNEIRSAAEHFITVEKAAISYTKLHYATLTQQATATTGSTITIANLKNAKCLPARFLDKNAWGQSYQIQTRKDKDSLAVVIVTTGGREHSTAKPRFGNILVPEAAALAKAGFVPTGVLQSASVLRGAYGSWEITLNSIGITATPGHLGTMTTLSQSDLAQDFLYRVAVPGQPELNAMQTSLNMTRHSINNVGDMQFTPKSLPTNFCTTPEDEGRTFLQKDNGLYICRNGKAEVITDTANSLLIKEAHVAVNNQRIKKPKCPDGINTTPEIFVAPQIASIGDKSPAIASVQAWAVSLSDDEWEVKMRILTVNDQWIYPASEYGRMFVMTSCAKKP